MFPNREIGEHTWINILSSSVYHFYLSQYSQYSSLLSFLSVSPLHYSGAIHATLQGFI